MNKYYRAQEERRDFNKWLSFDKKRILRIVNQSMINSANNVLVDDPPFKIQDYPPLLKRIIKAVQMGRQLLIRFQVDELIRKKE